MSTRNLHFRWCALLTLGYWIAVVLIDPRGEFPTNDDWGYSPPVQSLVLHGELRFTDWQSMPLLSHVLTGSLFAWLFGFSYEVLRISTLVVAWLGVLCTYGLALQLRASPSRAAFAAFLLAANPLFVGLSATFMSDTPFITAAIAASWAWLRSDERFDGFYVLAIVLAVWATLSRQLGLALPLAWGLTTTLRYRAEGAGSLPRRLLLAWVPLIFASAALFSFEHIVASTIGLPALYEEKSAGVKEALLALLRLRGLRLPVERSASSLIVLGLFALPLCALTLSGARRSWAVGAFGAAFAFALALVGFRLPFEGNVFIDFGMGPRTMLHAGDLPHAPLALWLSLSAFAGFGSGLVLERVLPPLYRWGVAFVVKREAPRRESSILWVALIAFAPTAIAYGAYFDRYLLLQLPLLLAFLARPPVSSAPTTYGRAIAATLAALTLGYSVAATHDYFGWQRARWHLVATLEAQGVARDEIEGGFEVNNEGAAAGDAFVEVRQNAEWALSFSASGAEASALVEACDPWLPWAPENVYAVRR